jgi:hypothetical protein
MNELNRIVVKFLISSIKITNWSKALYIISFSEGSYEGKFTIENEIAHLEPEIMSLVKEIRNDFKKLFPTNEKFNRVKFEILKDETYTVDYYWDQEAYLEEKQKSAKNFSDWVNWRLETMIYEAGYGDFDKWQYAISEFSNINGTLHYTGKIYVDNTAEELVLTFPQYMIDSFMEHFEITNNGILSHLWPKWNKLTVESHHEIYDIEQHEKYELV